MSSRKRINVWVQGRKLCFRTLFARPGAAAEESSKHPHRRGSNALASLLPPSTEPPPTSSFRERSVVRRHRGSREMSSWKSEACRVQTCAGARVRACVYVCACMWLYMCACVCVCARALVAAVQGCLTCAPSLPPALAHQHRPCCCQAPPLPTHIPPAPPASGWLPGQR